MFFNNLILLALSLLASLVQSAVDVETATALQDENNMIYLNPSNFESIINGIRPYYVSVLFTSSDPSLNCHQCERFISSYHKVSQAVYAQEKHQDLIKFAVVEVNDNKNIFNLLKMNTIPRVRIYPPSTNSTTNILSPFFEYKIIEDSFDPLHFGDHISKLLAISIVIPQEFALGEFASYFIITFAVIIIFKRLVISKAPKHRIFQVLSVGAILLFVCGYMFTVRGIPFISRDDKGQIIRFSGGTHWQFGSETFVIAGGYSAMITRRGS